MTDQTELVTLLKQYIAAKDDFHPIVEKRLYAQIKRVVGAIRQASSGPTKSVKVSDETVPVLPAKGA